MRDVIIALTFPSRIRMADTKRTISFVVVVVVDVLLLLLILLLFTFTFASTVCSSLSLEVRTVGSQKYRPPVGRVGRHKLCLLHLAELALAFSLSGW